MPNLYDLTVSRVTNLEPCPSPLRRIPAAVAHCDKRKPLKSYWPVLGLPFVHTSRFKLKTKILRQNRGTALVFLGGFAVQTQCSYSSYHIPTRISKLNVRVPLYSSSIDINSSSSTSSLSFVFYVSYFRSNACSPLSAFFFCLVAF